MKSKGGGLGGISAGIVLTAVVLVALGGRDEAFARPGTSAQDRPGQSTVPGQVLVRFADGGGPALRTVIAHRSVFARVAGARYNPRLGIWRFDVATRNVEKFIAALRARPGVEHAQPNYRYSNTAWPDDPLFASHQHPYYSAINLPYAWEEDGGGEPVTVAVIDGGVDFTHPELAARIWANPGEVVNGGDDDGNGCIDDLYGCSFQESPPNGNVNDLDGHGTFGAGIIAAERDNGRGIAGVTDSVVIMPVRALDEFGSGTTEQLVESINYATAHGARVLNLSLALLPVGGRCPGDPFVEEALREAHSGGATVAAAAGNFALGCVSFPASSEYAVAVAASGAAHEPDVRAFFSQWGPEIDVAAPGVNVVSTCPEQALRPASFCGGDAYGTGSGTSFSTPVVSGLVAELLSREPALSPDEVAERLRATAIDLPDEDAPNWDGAGRVDAAAFLGLPSAIVWAEVGGRTLAEIALTVEVGEGGREMCRADVVRRPALSEETLHGTFGAGACGPHWPPAEDRPWRLEATNTGRKAVYVDGWGLGQGGGPFDDARDRRCAGDAFVVPGNGGASRELRRCEATGRVPNDEPSGARVVNSERLPSHLEQELLYASSSDADPAAGCANAYSRSVWFRLTPDVAGAITADTSGSSFTTVLAVYEERGPGLEEVACNVSFSGDGSRVVWKAGAGETYYILTAVYQAQPAGRLRLNVNHAVVPANDSRGGARALVRGGVVVQPAHSATAEASDPDIACALYYGHSLWFRISLTEAAAINLTTAGSDYDTVLAVFREGAGGELEPVGCNDDAVPASRTSALRFEAEPGEYVVLVGAFLDDPGGALRVRVE